MHNYLCGFFNFGCTEGACLLKNIKHEARGASPLVQEHVIPLFDGIYPIKQPDNGSVRNYKANCAQGPASAQ